MTTTRCSECGGQVSSRLADCPHCGGVIDHQVACADCGEGFAASLVACPVCGGPVAGDEKSLVRYAPVQIDKFVVLFVATLGIYGLVWFYRNWRYIKTNEDTTIWPWARALFSPFWYYPMLKRLDVQRKGLLATVYFVLSIPSLARSDPAASTSLNVLFLTLGIAVLSLLTLIPAVKAINNLNQGSKASHPSFGWRGRNFVVLVIGLLFLLLWAWGSSLTTDVESVRFVFQTG
ncbi:uncharacterized protein METZ01_LOCUS299660 [marine metagenome]|uniref:DUF4234 domain-containing protein n=1 Tax=marine metagenome TaxID=408172 RepID=A0A382MDC9_9ZZZZ